MKDLARLALDTAMARGAAVADARAVELDREDLQVKDGKVGGVDRTESRGIGVRVVVNGGWGYAATDRLTREGVEVCAAEAVQIARASSSIRTEPVRLAPEPPRQAVWSSECAVDPFQVSTERKLDLLFRVDEALRRVKGVSITEGFLTFVRKRT